MARVATVLKAKSVNELWYGLIPIQIIGFILVMLLAVYLGFREKKRIQKGSQREKLNKLKILIYINLLRIMNMNKILSFQ